MSPRPRPDDVTGWASSLAATGGQPAALLAGVAGAIGVRWDGPGRPVQVEVPPAPGWVLLDAAREALLAPVERRRLGAHHTPADLVRRLVHLALDGLGPDAVVADPACGGGAFLVGAADALVQRGADPASVVTRQLVGIDVDPLAAATTRAALRCWSSAHGAAGTDPQGIAAGDGLAAAWSADVVVGNPPFLSPLGTATSGGRAAARLRSSLGAPYADVAWLFLLRSLESVEPGGRVVLLQPESLLSARDACPVREATADHLAGMWVAGEPVFGAAVRVCAPVLTAAQATGPVQRWRGATVRPAGRVARPPAAAWARLRPTSAPTVRVATGGPVLGDIATATAGFRDEFYGLAAAATDGGRGRRLVTSGLVEPGRHTWGERAARIGGHRFERPTVDPASLPPRLAAWVAARSVPKVLVATQTRVVEAVADPAGELVPLTPVLSVEPHRGADVWRVAAALTSPVVSAWALRTYGGAALAGDAIKLSARQVLAAPLPGDARAWALATRALRRGDVVACGTALAGGDDRLLAWWRGRLPARPAG